MTEIFQRSVILRTLKADGQSLKYLVQISTELAEIWGTGVFRDAVHDDRSRSKKKIALEHTYCSIADFQHFQA